MEAESNYKMTPARAMKILKEHGTEISEEQAVRVIEFLGRLAKMTVAQYLREGEEDIPRIGQKINSSKRA